MPVPGARLQVGQASEASVRSHTQSKGIDHSLSQSVTRSVALGIRSIQFVLARRKCATD